MQIAAGKDHLSKLGSLLKEIECNPVDQPLNQHYIRLKFTKTMEDQFNQFWLHMYRILLDLESRRLPSTSQRALDEHALLTDYAKKAVMLYGGKARGVNIFDKEHNELLGIEGEIKRQKEPRKILRRLIVVIE